MRAQTTSDDEPPKLAGQSIRDLRWALEATLGAEPVSRGLASVSEEIRREYADALPMQWVTYTTVVAVHEAIAREAGVTMEALLEKAVPVAVERSFKTVWRLLLRFTSDEALIARTPLFYARSRNKGKLTSKILEPGRAVVELSGWPTVPPRDVRSLSLSIATIIRLAGRDRVRVTGERTPEGARFDVRWHR